MGTHMLRIMEIKILRIILSANWATTSACSQCCQLVEKLHNIANSKLKEF